MRVRGLKHPVVRIGRGRKKSHPMRVRGLKRVFQAVNGCGYLVAPHAGAWIETPEVSRKLPPGKCRTPCGCVD